VGNNNASTTYGGAMTNTGALTKIGTGTLTLSGNNTYTGNTVISNGTLALSGSGAIASSNMRVATGATFDVSAVTGGNYSLNAAGTLTLNIAKAGPSLTQGQVQATTLTAGGTLNIAASGDALTGGESFTLFNVTPGGTFAATSLPSLASGLNWFTANNYRTLSVNRAPVAQPQSFSVTQGDTASLTVIGGKYSPTDVDPGDTANLIVTAVGAVSPGSAGTAGFTSSNVTFTAANNFSGTATLNYTVSDTRGGSDTKTVTVTATPAASGANLAWPTFNTPGVATLNGLGIPGHTYQLQYTESLNPVNWQDVTGPLATAAASVSNGALSLVDTNAGGPSRFYRTRHVSAP
jgi:autotransporter-associated beta strand protein